MNQEHKYSLVFLGGLRIAGIIEGNRIADVAISLSPHINKLMENPNLIDCKHFSSWVSQMLESEGLVSSDFVDDLASSVEKVLRCMLEGFWS